MNVEIGVEAAQFPEKEYINGIAVAVNLQLQLKNVKFHHTGNFWRGFFKAGNALTGV
jgi:hypothetical protein